jgi:hypothetical protein
VFLFLGAIKGEEDKEEDDEDEETESISPLRLLASAKAFLKA